MEKITFKSPNVQSGEWGVWAGGWHHSAREEGPTLNVVFINSNGHSAFKLNGTMQNLKPLRYKQSPKMCGFLVNEATKLKWQFT